MSDQTNVDYATWCIEDLIEELEKIQARLKRANEQLAERQPYRVLDVPDEEGFWWRVTEEGSFLVTVFNDGEGGLYAITEKECTVRQSVLWVGPITPPNWQTAIQMRESRACSVCGAKMERGHVVERIGFGDYPGTGRHFRLWCCEPCDRTEERPDNPQMRDQQGDAVTDSDKSLKVTVNQNTTMSAPNHIPESCKLIAHHTGDGWYLAVQNAANEEIAILAWPKQWGDTVSSQQLETFGFEVV